MAGDWADDLGRQRDRRTMRMLVLATRTTDQHRGDPEPRSLLIRGLLDLGHEVHLVCAGDEPLRSAGDLTVHPVHADRAGVVPAFSSRSFQAAARCAPDAVFAERSHLALGWAIAARAKSAFVPIIDAGEPGGLAWQTGLRQALGGRFVRGSDACVAFGPAAADAARRLGGTRVVELPGVSSIEGRPPGRTGWLRRHLGLSQGVLAVSWGTLSPEQGTDALIEGVKVAADADADVHAAVFGGDELSIGRYEAKTQRLGIDHRVHLLGPWPANRLGTLLAEADIVIEPDATPLATPRALYTFLASGRPVVLAEAPERGRLIEPAACYLTPSDRLGIGHALVELAAGKDLRTRIAEAAEAYVARRHTYAAFQSALAAIGGLVAPSVAPGSA